METINNPENQNTYSNFPQNNNYKILFFVFFTLFLIVSSVLVTLLFTQKTSEITNITEAEEQKITPTEIPISEVTTTPANPTIKLTSTSTSSDVPNDWKIYSDPTHKFSISYPPEWTLETNINDINRFTDVISIKSPEGEKEEKRIKSEPPTAEGYISPCGFYYIYCYESFDLFKTKTRVKDNTLLSYLKSSDFGDFTQSTTNGDILYSVISNSLDGGREFYIQNKDTSFCYLQFCGQTSSGKELTTTEKQFVNTFKFN
jgi:hypothetical protein